MATATSASATSRATRGRYRGPRRGGPHGGSTTGNTVPHNAALALRPTSVAPETQTPAQSSRGDGRRGRFSGRGRGRAHLMVNGQRAFGGQLTTATLSEGSLAGDAPEFVPGQPVAPRSRQSQCRNPPHRRMSKSGAPDMATRTHEDIMNGQYECVICTNEVLSNSKVWSCRTCWSVLHLSCVKRWSKNKVSTHQQRAGENGELPPPRQWRCPGCNLPKVELPNDYFCWCGKEIEPRSIAGLPPHSCGQSCSKRRTGSCPHPCELICHAGPCPPCGHMGPSISCFCGKEMTSRRCLDTNYENGWNCGQICGEVLPCGEHACQRECHEGLCGSCDVEVESRCYCGRVEQTLRCSERDDELESQMNGGNWIGSFNCGAECRRPFDCGNPKHCCEQSCHVQALESPHCPLSPDVVTHCPCGKTPIDILLSEPRLDCSAPVPHCQESCRKVLGCSHLCELKCHGGRCRPCLKTVEISCRCGRTTSKSVCHQGLEEPPQCPRVCRSTLNCGRHECGERCCQGEKKAYERQASKRKHRALNVATVTGEEFEPEHICLRVCGRPLKCGNHSCSSLCHKGPCASCLEAVFEDISCACGKTVLQPPQPCGTKPPECRFDCTRQRNCGHPQVKHQCHQDSEGCPKCPFLVEKPCICGKKTLKNQPCWFSEVRCGLPCNKRLRCGNHFCQSMCHRAGQCEDATSHCTQACGRKKTVCEHICSDPCHAPYPCKEMTPCQAKTFITCECQNQKQAIKCLASKTSPGNSKKTLECNEECLKVQRNAKLAAALKIDPATYTDDHVPYSADTLSLFAQNQKFGQQYEREFRVFAADDREKRLRLKPMQANQRAFIHALAEDFGLDSESQDPEPHRHVCIFKTPKFISAPAKTLGQCAKLRAAPVSERSKSKPLVSNAEPWNAFLLGNPKFGITIDELYADLKPEFAKAGIDFEISFLPSGDIVLKSLSTGSWLLKMDRGLAALKTPISKKISSLGLASSTSLCAVDPSLNVLRLDDQNAASGGWSQVAKGGPAAMSMAAPGIGAKSSFTVLGRRMKENEKKKAFKEPVDDWELEADAA
ncbi:hypothetical protein PZA11_000808 [Diplocarpon coronariae]